MDKLKVVEQLKSYLVEELRDLVHDKPESEWDKLSEDEARRAGEIRSQLVMYRFLPVREYSKDDVICPAGLVELDFNGNRAFYFIVPSGGGLVTRVDGSPIQVITPNSPLGEALLGKKVGDTIQVKMTSSTRSYRIVSFV